MRHNQYREGLLERLRTWRIANVNATIAQARKELRAGLNKSDIDLLFDNWLNANFDRIEVKSEGPHRHTAVIRGRNQDTPEQRAEKRREHDAIVSRGMAITKDTFFESFAAQIWETVLPNGVVMRDATGKDLKHAHGWFGVLAGRMKSTEKVHKKFTTKQLFDLSKQLS